MKQKYFLVFIVSLGLVFTGCASSILHIEKSEDLQKNDEFEKAVRIENIGEEIKSPDLASGLPHSGGEAKVTPTVPSSKGSAKAETEDSKKKVKDTGASKAKGAKDIPLKAGDKSLGKVTEKANKATKESSSREPSLEDSVGFDGRRPLKDPFRVGEVITHNVNYFKVSAGDIKFKVEDFANVNGKKSYSFATELKTSTLFETFYKVDDRAVTQVGFDDLVPSAFQLHVKESGQLREARSFFDWNKSKAFFWEKKVTKDKGEQVKKIDWDIAAYSQNVFSAIFYMRVFKWEDGKEYQFRVAHDNENLVFKGKVVRREVLETEAGTFKAIVVKPEFTVKGLFKPVGDIYIWLSDDDRKYVLRIESKIKIGTLISEVTQIEPGR